MMHADGSSMVVHMDILKVLRGPSVFAKLLVSKDVSFHVLDELGSSMTVWYEVSSKRIKVFITTLPAVLTFEPFAFFHRGTGYTFGPFFIRSVESALHN
jgi:hypothetical protein